MLAKIEQFMNYPAINNMKKNHPKFDIYAAAFLNFLPEVKGLNDEQKEQLSQIKTLELMNVVLQLTIGRETTKEKAAVSLALVTEFVKNKRIEVGSSGKFVVDLRTDEALKQKVNRATKDFYKWKKDKVKYPEIWGWTDALCFCLNERMEWASYLLHQERGDLYSEKTVKVFVDDFLLPWRKNIVFENAGNQERLCWKLRY